MLYMCQKEVKELHSFFEDWFTAKLPKSNAVLDRMSEALAADFQIVTPEGVLLTGNDLIDQLRKSHGSQANRDQYYIEISNFDGRALTDDGSIFLTNYEEHQYIDDEENVRFSTSLFRSNPEAPNEVEWIHVHEVWIT